MADRSTSNGSPPTSTGAENELAAVLASLPESRRPSETPSGEGATGAGRPPKRRLRWTPALHNSFLDAVNRLGGADAATPATIKRVMASAAAAGGGAAAAPTLSLTHIKSHLQKFRLSLKAAAASGDTAAATTRITAAVAAPPPPPLPPPIAVAAPLAHVPPPPPPTPSAVLVELRAALTEQAGLQTRLHALKAEQAELQRCLAAQAARAARLVAALQGAPATAGLPPQPRAPPVPDAPQATVHANGLPLPPGKMDTPARRGARRRAVA